MKIFQTTKRIIIGEGAFAAAAEEAVLLGAHKVLIVTGQNIIKTNYIDALESKLNKNGIKATVFSDVEPDPSYETALKAGSAAIHSSADTVIGVGGGSSLDVAKIASILATNDKPITEMFGVNLVPKPGLKLILIPTTAGTGSEVTHISILSDERERIKTGIVSQYLLPDIAIVDPVLTVSSPPDVTAYSGMDALVHAVEAFTSVNATVITDTLAAKAIELISANLRRAYANGDNMEARSAMAIASMMAGQAFANAGVTATHAFAYPIGAVFHIPHGIANSIMFPAVMKFNMTANLPKFARIASLMGINTHNLTDRQSALKMVEFLQELIADLRLPSCLSYYGVKESDIPSLATGVMKVTRILANNPRKLTLKDAEEIYKNVL